MRTTPVSMPTRLFRAYAQHVVAYRWAVFIAAIALTVFWGSRMGTLQLDTDPKTWTPQKHPYVTATNLLDDVFGGKNIAVIGIVPKTGDVYQPQVLAKIQRIQAGIEQIPHAVRHNILSFAARKVKAIKGGPDGMEVRPLMEKIPQTRVGPVMITAGLIATLTFFSLTSTGVPMVQHFGVCAGCGVLSTMLLEMSLIPALRSLLRPPRVRETLREQQAGVLDRFLEGLAAQLVGGRAGWFLSGGIALLLAIGTGTLFLRVDNNFKLYEKPTSTMRVHDGILNATFGGTNTFQFLVQTQGQDGIKDPKVLQAVADLQAFLESQPDVGKTQSLADLVKRMNQAMHGDDPKYYSLPASRDLIAQYLFLYSLSGDPQDFDSYVDNNYGRAAIWAYLKSDSTSYADALAHKVQTFVTEHFPPGVTVEMGGSLPEIIALNQVVIRDKFQNISQMGLVVFVLGAIMFRSLMAGLFVVTPLIAVTIANFGLMGWIGTPLDMPAISAAAMAIGVGADYEIYLLFRFREELERSGDVLTATRASLLTSGKAILFVALSIVGGYSVMQVADFAVYKQISNMVITTMTMSALFALFFLRALRMLVKQ